MVFVVVLYMSYVSFCLLFFFFFKQKTAYEMRISDWSSDVCSSDLVGEDAGVAAARELHLGRPRRGAAGKGDRAAVRYAETAAGIGPVEPAARKTGRGGAHPSVEADARDLGFAMVVVLRIDAASVGRDRKSTRLNSSH